jgi:sulfatase maturation enzyme AslB (radical SAM superfamily)
MNRWAKREYSATELRLNKITTTPSILIGLAILSLTQITQDETMIKIIPIQEAYKRKIERQQGLKELKFKCHGSCAYIGEDISPGCYGCFYSDAFHRAFLLGRDVGLPDVCNRDCVYCFEPHMVRQDYSPPEGFSLGDEWKDIIREYLAQEKQIITTDATMQYYEFTGVCEPLFYISILEEFMQFFRNVVDPFMGTKGWAKVYTNGTLLNLDNILRLKDSGFDEVRVHLGATHFSDTVYDMSVSLPSLLKHRPGPLTERNYSRCCRLFRISVLNTLISVRLKLSVKHNLAG